MRGEQLGQKTECGDARSGWSTVNDEHQRILLVALEIGRIDQHAVFVKIVGTLPLKSFDLALMQPGNVLVKVGEAFRRVVGGGHVVQLRRLRRSATGEGNL